MTSVKGFVKGVPIIGDIVSRTYRFIRSQVAFAHDIAEQKAFPGSKMYWEDRYVKGGNSGAGSYGRLATFKAEILNSFVEENEIKSVLEFGCGDGNQLTLARYPRYVGFDVSVTAIDLCMKKFERDRTKSFYLIDAYAGQIADLALSLDVIFHLVENDVFEEYMRRLFRAATRFVIIYSSNIDKNDAYQGSHVNHRKFTDWVERNCDGWFLKTHIPNKYPGDGNDTENSFADFYIYERTFQN